MSLSFQHLTACQILCLAGLAWRPVEARRGFEGMISMESYVMPKPQSETLYVKGLRWRFEGFEMNAREAGSIIGDDKGHITLLLPSRRTYAHPPFATDLDEAVKRITFTKADRSESVAGSQCAYYKVHFEGTDSGDRQFCVATALGFVGFTPEIRVHEGLASIGLGAVARRTFPEGFVVLKALDRSGKVVFEVKKIERRAVSDDMFEPPPGWKEAPMGRGGPPR